MTLFNFFTTLGRMFTGKVTHYHEFLYSMREGLEPREPAYVRWGMAMKEEKLPPRTDMEKDVPRKQYKLLLRDKFGLRPDDMFYFSEDKKKMDTCLNKILEELRSRTASEFYYMWITNRNVDFLIHVKDDYEFEER